MVLNIVIIVLLILNLILNFIFSKKSINTLPVENKIGELQGNFNKIESALKEDFRNNREEIGNISRDNRKELGDALREMNQTLKTELDGLSKIIDEKLNQMNNQVKADNNLMRDTLTASFLTFQDVFEKNVKSFNDLQREKFSQLEERQSKLVETTEKRLEEMRITVDEKLQKTLNERLGQSFELVGKQLESVQKGLGEMQNIASDVGGLKKVLSNVKLRGGVGEVQLAMILEQILAPTQYDVNVKTKQGSGDPVEFAIKLPGKSDDENSFVYLPIDAKFPKDVYEQLLNAYESADATEIDSATRNLEGAIKKMAKDIRDKYIDPPNTTDFAILFLPFESIYAEVIRRSNLVDQLRDEFKITVAGPTTLVAILNSLQMGFRTLALQKRSSEVWKVLGAVKTEFNKFGGLLEKAQKNLHTASDNIDELLGTRTRAINRKLKNIEILPSNEDQQLLPDMEEEDGDGDI
jgi:DNA recombination protein RmuC